MNINFTEKVQTSIFSKTASSIKNDIKKDLKTFILSLMNFYCLHLNIYKRKFEESQ